MWDDGSHNDIFDKFGHSEKRAVSLSLADNPGPGYVGPEYAVGGSQARHWVDTANYPWLPNLIAALENDTSIDLVLLSLGGNDVLAGKDSGGWYKDMDLDVPGSEQAFFDRLEQDMLTILQAVLDVRPSMRVMISAYDYPNFNVGFWCFVSACPMRRNLSRDPDNDLITDAEINAILITIEQMRVDWANSDPRILFDNSLGLMHYYYGDGVSPPRTLPHPGQTPPAFDPLAGGNPLRPSLRSNFRRPSGLDVDPIHLDVEGYQYKITNETQATFFPEFRGDVTETFVSEGGDRDGWTDGVTIGLDAVRVGADGAARRFGIVSFDTSSIPDGSTVTAASLYLMRASSTGTNPFSSGELGVPLVDVAGTFGAVQVEAADASATADATDAGIVVGSAWSNGYAVRIDLTAAGLAALDDAGRTQFRIAFPTAGAGIGTHDVGFADGDAPGPIGALIPDLSDYMGSAAPFLDVAYDAPTDVVVGPAAHAGLSLSRASSNPFVASTTLLLRLPNAARARLVVYDVRGRRVRTLVDSALSRGPHLVDWDGLDAHGQATPPGVYWARMSVGGQVRTQKLVRLGP